MRHGPGPLGINDLDSPESIRLRAYTTGTHVALREIDVVTAATPRDLVWSTGATRLYRYRAAAAAGRRGTPLLLIYGFVLRSTILDLVPDNSIVEHLVAQGFDVYLLDFAIAGDNDADLSVEDLVLDHIPGAVTAVLAVSEAEQVSVLGVSQGGTLAVCTPRWPQTTTCATWCCSRRLPSSPRPTPGPWAGGRWPAGPVAWSSTRRWSPGSWGTCRPTSPAR